MRLSALAFLLLAAWLPTPSLAQMSQPERIALFQTLGEAVGKAAGACNDKSIIDDRMPKYLWALEFTDGKAGAAAGQAGLDRGMAQARQDDDACKAAKSFLQEEDLRFRSDGELMPRFFSDYVFNIGAALECGAPEADVTLALGKLQAFTFFTGPENDARRRDILEQGRNRVRGKQLACDGKAAIVTRVLTFF